MAADNPLVIAAAAAQGFPVLHCQQCADNIKQALQRAGHQGAVLEIRDKQRRNFIVCISYDGGATTITQNGRHVAVRVGATVFDNLHPAGVAYDAWLADFDSATGVEVSTSIQF